MLSKQVPAKDSLEFAFQVFDPNGRGCINEEDFTKILKRCFPKLENSHQIFTQIDADQNGVIDYGKHYSLSQLIPKDEFVTFIQQPEYYDLFKHICVALEKHVSLDSSMELSALIKSM